LDGASLHELLSDARERQYWLKPIGYPKDHPDWDAFESRKWTVIAGQELRCRGQFFDKRG
jgi:hypothetical protein